jgi:hypothetical protein
MADDRLHGSACAGMKRARLNNHCWVCSNKTAAERGGRPLYTPWCCSKCPKTKKSYLVTAAADDEYGDAQYFLAFFANNFCLAKPHRGLEMAA